MNHRKGQTWPNELQGKRIAILAADGVERVELEQPREAVHRAGAQTQLLSIKSGEIAFRNNDLEDAGTFQIDRQVSEASVDDYDALLLPGGKVNADKLRIDNNAVSFVRAFAQSCKPIGVICHGPWSLLEAAMGRRQDPDIVPEHSDRLAQRDANVVDREVVIDGNYISSRSPNELPAYCSVVVERFATATV